MDMSRTLSEIDLFTKICPFLEMKMPSTKNRKKKNKKCSQNS